MAYDTLPTSGTLKPVSFQANVPQKELDDFKQLLRLSKVAPKTFENAQEDRRFGVPRSELMKLKEHWETSYDWRKAEARINSYPNYKVDVKDDDGNVINVHFVALFSQKKDALALTFLHGWPGSFLEFLDMLDVFKSKYSPEELPYNIIVPSLPGYAYSAGAPLDKDWGNDDIARIVDKLMQGLGFNTYVAQGGDVGSFVCRELGASHPACKAVHLNFNIMGEPEGIAADQVSSDEMKALARGKEFSTVGNAYAREHGTKPSTIGLTLSSSPVALLAWISEKFLAWSDQDPPMDAILDSVTLYWFTESFPRAIYPYRMFVRPDRDTLSPDSKFHLKIPMGYSWFPLELAPIPVAWVAKTGNLVWSKKHSDGGHFAAMEKPAELAQDIEEFMAQIGHSSSRL